MAGRRDYENIKIKSGSKEGNEGSGDVNWRIKMVVPGRT
jgi:hypothetical protein